MRIASLALLPLVSSLLVGCPRANAGPSGPAKVEAASEGQKPVARGAPLDFVLDPLDRDYEHRPESEVLRGKRAIVLALETFDVGSLVALRTLAPLLNELPADVACLQVAMQPIGDRPLVGPFMDAEKTPCRRAIGDVKRGRLGDLAKITVIPTVLVLRADGTLVGARAGTVTVEEIRALLEQAK